MEQIRNFDALIILLWISFKEYRQAARDTPIHFEPILTDTDSNQFRRV